MCRHNLFTLYCRMAAIHQAALQGNVDCINLLLNNGAHCDIQDNKGERDILYTDYYRWLRLTLELCNILTPWQPLVISRCHSPIKYFEYQVYCKSYLFSVCASITRHLWHLIILWWHDQSDPAWWGQSTKLGYALARSMLLTNSVGPWRWWQILCWVQ